MKPLATLILALFLPLSAEVKGTPLLTLTGQLGFPLKLAQGAAGADWAPATLSFPYGIHLDFGYLWRFTPHHRLSALASLSYDDDPVNHIFDPLPSTKDLVPSFTQQSFDQVASVKYTWQPTGFLSIGAAADGGFRFVRSAPSEGFSNGLYNSSFWGIVVDSEWGFESPHPLLAGLDARVSAGVHAFAYPNDGYEDLLEKGEAILFNPGLASDLVKTNKGDQVNLGVGARVGESFSDRLRLVLSWNLTLDAWLTKAAIDLSGNPLANKEWMLRQKAQARLEAVLAKAKDGRPLLGAGLAVEGRWSDANVTEQVIVDRSLLGDLPASVLSNAAPAGNQVGLSFPAYHRWGAVTFLPSLDWHPSRRSTLFLQYGFTTRVDAGRYATWGTGENPARVAGAFKGETAIESIHTANIGLEIADQTGVRRVTPTLGWQWRNSNDRGGIDGNYHLIFAGVKTVFEF